MNGNLLGEPDKLVSRPVLIGLSVGAAVGNGGARSSGRAAGLEFRRELFLGRGGTAGNSSSSTIGLALLREASDPILLGNSIPPTVSIAGKAGGLAEDRGIGLTYDSPAVENESRVLGRSVADPARSLYGSGGTVSVLLVGSVPTGGGKSPGGALLLLTTSNPLPFSLVLPFMTPLNHSLADDTVPSGSAGPVFIFLVPPDPERGPPRMP